MTDENTYALLNSALGSTLAQMIDGGWILVYQIEGESSRVISTVDPDDTADILEQQAAAIRGKQIGHVWETIQDKPS